MPGHLKIGVLGAARIAQLALIRPSRKLQQVEVAAVAARDRDRAQRYADRHGIPTVHDSYRALIEDDELDAVYIPLPNALHAEWTIRAIEADKHVLCEKPFASNASEAREVAEAARGSDVVVMEAFHWRYHPLGRRMVEIVAGGEIGQIRTIEAWVAVPIPAPTNIRWQEALSGGSMMDMGCYAVSQVRHLSGEEPVVRTARARTVRGGVDAWMTAELDLPSGAQARVHSNMATPRVRIGCRVVGDHGTLRVRNPVVPQYFHHLTTRYEGGRVVRERFGRTPTYEHQLKAFVDCVTAEAPVLTDADGAVANMEVIDSIYRVAGMQPRGAVKAAAAGGAR